MHFAKLWRSRILLIIGLGLLSGVAGTVYELTTGKSWLLGSFADFAINWIGGSIFAAVILLPIAQSRSRSRSSNAKSAPADKERATTILSRPPRFQPAPETRGFDIALSCLGFLSLVALAVGLVVLQSVLTNTTRGSSILLALVAIVALPTSSIALGVWTWRTNRAWRHASITAILLGAFAIACTIVLFVVFLVTLS
jgi:hypothetical protein